MTRWGAGFFMLGLMAAGEPAGQNATATVEVGALRARLLEVIDQDGDGTVSAREAQAAQEAMRGLAGEREDHSWYDRGLRAPWPPPPPFGHPPPPPYGRPPPFDRDERGEFRGPPSEFGRHFDPPPVERFRPEFDAADRPPPPREGGNDHCPCQRGRR